MTVNPKLKKMFESLNENDVEKARALFHDVVVEMSREIYKELDTEDEFDFDFEEEDFLLDPDFDSEELNFGSDKFVDEANEIEDLETDLEVDVEDDLEDDLSQDVEDVEDVEDFEDDEDTDDLEDRIEDIEDAFEELKREFDAIVAGEDEVEVEDISVDELEDEEVCPNIKPMKWHLECCW